MTAEKVIPGCLNPCFSAFSASLVPTPETQVYMAEYGHLYCFSLPHPGDLSVQPGLKTMASHDSLCYFAKLNPGTVHVTGERDMQKQWYLQMACSLYEITAEVRGFPILPWSSRLCPQFLVCRSSCTTAYHCGVTRTTGSNPALGHIAAQQP